ncbi:t-SNARE family protein [Pelomyxa schiedti]|nr:t-SNARE family protein [Pelomyxa schiedti]
MNDRMGDLARAAPPDYASNFEGGIETVQNNASQISAKVAAARQTIKECTMAIGDQLQKKQAAARQIVDELEMLVGQTKNILDQLKKVKPGNPTEKRMHDNMLSAAAKRFVKSAQEFQAVQQEFEKTLKDRFTRQCKIVKPSITNEEVQVIIDSGDTRMFQQATLDPSLMAATSALEYVENKHNDILRLQQSINELNQLFLDMAILVDSQTELVDQIEMHVEHAHHDVKKGTEEMRDALALQKSARKKMCCCCFC